MNYARYEPVEKLKEYVSLPAGSHDLQELEDFARVLIRDFGDLGFSLERHDHDQAGPTLIFRRGKGERRLMLMGHMDTAFPRDEAQSYKMEGDLAYGCGAGDMRGGLVVMLFALKQALERIDFERYSIAAVIHSDGETGALASRPLIQREAQNSFAVLGFAPMSQVGGLILERRGASAFELQCAGARGDAEAPRGSDASAIQELANRIVGLYGLRDDGRGIDINISSIEGGTGQGGLASEASAHGEARYDHEQDRAGLLEKIETLCAAPGLKGSTTRLLWGAHKPALKATQESKALLQAARRIAMEMGVELAPERMGAPGDIAFAALTGIPALDGLGMMGGGAHTRFEYTRLDRIPFKIALAARLIEELTWNEVC